MVIERTEQKLTLLPISHGVWGLVIIAIFWPLNCLLPGLRTAYLFFPLWLGYILAVDALVLVRSGTSLLARSRRDFFLLFVVSAPAWWLFEIINQRTRNWEYLGREHFTDLEYFVLCSVAFSTVMPRCSRLPSWFVLSGGRIASRPDGELVVALARRSSCLSPGRYRSRRSGFGRATFIHWSGSRSCFCSNRSTSGSGARISCNSLVEAIGALS